MLRAADELTDREREILWIGLVLGYGTAVSGALLGALVGWVLGLIIYR